MLQGGGEQELGDCQQAYSFPNSAPNRAALFQHKAAEAVGLY